MASTGASAGINNLNISGLDLNSLLTNITTQEQGRLTPLTNKQTAYNSQITSFGILKTSLDKLNTATESLAKINDIATTSVSSSNTAFTATTTANAAAGNYAVAVTQIAQAQSLISTSVASETDKLGTPTTDRTLTIAQPGLNKTTTISLSDSQTSLTEIRDAINKSDSGVTASIVKANDSSFQLMLTANDTGLKSEITVQSNDTSLDNLLHYETTTPANNKSTQLTAAQNATFTLNGIAIERQSNTINDAIDGVTFNLKKLSDLDTTTTPSTYKTENLTVSKDTSQLQTAIQAWVDAYNSLQTTIKSQTKYVAVSPGDTTQSTGNGALLGNSTVQGIQRQLQSQLTSIQSQSGTLKILNDLGIKQIATGTDQGKLEVDTTKLQKALNEQPDNVKAFFLGDGKTTGFATQSSQYLTEVLNTNNGLIQTSTDGINTSLKALSKQIENTTNSINDNIARYKAQFVQLNTLVSQLNGTSSSLTSLLSSSSSSSK
ncbi:flagellar filament capping protein FliD [Prodigiosinella confusarubida]|uniref:Flagellar hook-associated protein 2 n=1 Tax=Serratia sp. (strain ATCC 39006) TaxID=104623 RepID=A0A2I5TJG3_SERS3|nr:flagellar filament capping protein FliD [Serratia sp. ATCC 39006]AUH00389.1 flagellar filament capping protein FliD [Serratia sp. ATCC 39006]AUH04709.1 flagellar filament capping protein FliD [Serratia sp. ATCC 39006]